jgi:glutamate/tyrosine decarboxylase-like PLP-dependent enzyme
LAGGPPVRGTILPYWEPVEALSDEELATWTAAANRIASGLSALAHLSVTVDPTLCVVAFSCGRDLKLARNYEGAIRAENLEVRIIEAADGELGIALPCRPDVTDEEIKHAVLAGVKAAHTVEFIPIDDQEVLAQLAAIQAVEACVVDFGRKMKGIGSGVKRGLGRIARLP